MNLAHAKRFYERWIADPIFQESLRRNPIDACERYRLKIDPYTLKPLWENEPGAPFGDESGAGNYPLLLELRNLLQSLANDEIAARAESAKNKQYKAWRGRQIARCKSQFKRNYGDTVKHIAVCFELSKGCSVGCWFCALDPEPLKAVFEYTPGNQKLWRDVLQTMQDALGPAAGAGLCYCATEPFDNPDYERFCLDYFDVLGVFPPTVTAKAAQDAARTRRLIDLNRKKNGRSPSLSITSLKDLNTIHSAFGAEELLHTYLALRNRESATYFTYSGRAMRYARRKPFRNLNFHRGRTTACLSGFLLNMVEQSVRLISPCIPDERWPLGYRMYTREVFTDASDLKRILRDMMDKHMPLRIRESDAIRLRPDLVYRELEDGFQVSTPFMIRRFRNYPYLRAFGEILRRGDTTVGELISVCDFFTVPKENALDLLNVMLEEGLLSEEPKIL